jgi:hypothetical protein
MGAMLCVGTAIEKTNRTDSLVAGVGEPKAGSGDIANCECVPVPWDDEGVADRRETFDKLLAVWNGDAGVDELDSLLSPSYLGHLGSRVRNVAGLKRDIADYRDRVPGVRFRVEHQFGEGDYLASRLTAHAVDATASESAIICGMNISLWKGGLLAEEWAVWETFAGN